MSPGEGAMSPAEEQAAPEGSPMSPAERQAALAAVLARLPAAMAAQALAAGVLEQGVQEHGTPAPGIAGADLPAAEQAARAFGPPTAGSAAEVPSVGPEQEPPTYWTPGARASGSRRVPGARSGAAPRQGQAPLGQTATPRATPLVYGAPAAQQRGSVTAAEVSPAPGAAAARRLATFDATWVDSASATTAESDFATTDEAPTGASEQSRQVFPPVSMVGHPRAARGAETSGSTNTHLSFASGGLATATSSTTATHLSHATSSQGAAPAVQRQLDVGHGSSTNGEPTGTVSIQRMDGDAGSQQAEESNQTMDLDALADEVYARLRWRLSAERERTFG